jgi:hypothetical protein
MPTRAKLGARGPSDGAGGTGDENASHGDVPRVS